MFDNAKAFHFEDHRFWLLPEKAMYWPKHNTLLLADLHIGKSGHFRRNGIAVPEQLNRSNLNALDDILDKTSPDHFIILGDLFHSDINKEWRQFVKWRKDYNQLEISLVIGNHDILEKENYQAGIINLFKQMTLDSFLLVHNVENYSPLDTDKYILSGHVHPAVKLTGRGRQSIKLPCFYFGKDYGILPAFGAFTGTHIIEPEKDDHVFIIAKSKVLSA